MCPILRFNGQLYSTYALMTYLAFFVSVFCFYYIATRWEKYSSFLVISGVFLIFFVQLAGGWILPGLYKWYRFGPYPLEDLPRKGRYFHSVFLSSLLFLALYAKLVKWPVRRTLDIFAITSMVMSALSRFGCFLHGCCSGKPSALPWALKFPRQEDFVHPTQLYHFFFEAFILIPVLLYVYKHRKFEGQTILTLGFLYSLFRFFVEFFRTNPIAWGGMTHAQLFSAPVAAICGWFLYKNLKAS